MKLNAQSAYSSVPAVNMTSSKCCESSFRNESAPGLMESWPSFSFSSSKCKSVSSRSRTRVYSLWCSLLARYGAGTSFKPWSICTLSYLESSSCLCSNSAYSPDPASPPPVYDTTECLPDSTVGSSKSSLSALPTKSTLSINPTSSLVTISSIELASWNSGCPKASSISYCCMAFETINWRFSYIELLFIRRNWDLASLRLCWRGARIDRAELTEPGRPLWTVLALAWLAARRDGELAITWSSIDVRWSRKLGSLWIKDSNCFAQALRSTVLAGNLSTIIWASIRKFCRDL